MILAGDIGGTKTQLGLFTPECERVTSATYSSKKYDSLETMAQEFLKGKIDQVDRACFGVAGPVMNGHAKITNLPWEMDEGSLGKALDVAHVRLLNDLESIAYSVAHLEGDDLHTLHEGKADPEGNIAIIAPGTGLGQAFLTWNPYGYDAHASEGGHVDFAPIDDLQVGLLQYLQGQYGHVSVERVASGMGLPNIYNYLVSIEHAQHDPAIDKAVREADDPTPVIVQSAITGKCPLCIATLDMFISIVASEAGNLALKIMSTGGLYIGGGIPKRILHEFEKPQFMESFKRKGRMGRILENMPIKVIMNTDAPLLGAAHFAIEKWD